MKLSYLIVLLCLSCFSTFAQQSTPLKQLIKKHGPSVIKTESVRTHLLPADTGKFGMNEQSHYKSVVTVTTSDTTYQSISQSRFSIFGMGDVSTQTLSQINASGKISFYVRPFSKYFSKKHITTHNPGDKVESQKNEGDGMLELITSMFVSLNVNAVNRDTLIQGTILFPDLGNSSILFTPEAGILSHTPSSLNNANWSYYYGVLGEFCNKTIVSHKKENGSDTSLHFYVNSLTGGIKVIALYQPNNMAVLSVGLVAYYNYAHVPNKDSKDFKYILRQPGLSTNFHSIGIRFIFGINDCQIYADLRHTFYHQKTMATDRGLASFNTNIGIMVPITILKFPK